MPEQPQCLDPQAAERRFGLRIPADQQIDDKEGTDPVTGIERMSHRLGREFQIAVQVVDQKGRLAGLGGRPAVAVPADYVPLLSWAMYSGVTTRR